MGGLPLRRTEDDREHEEGEKEADHGRAGGDEPQALLDPEGTDPAPPLLALVERHGHGHTVAATACRCPFRSRPVARVYDKADTAP
jgi:hypothetical protein